MFFDDQNKLFMCLHDVHVNQISWDILEDAIEQVVKQNNNTNSKLTKHLKWIQNVSADQSISSYLASNLTTIGQFAWYAGVFDEHTLNQINSSDVIQYITRDIMVRSYHNIELNTPSWGLSRISKKSLPIDNKYHYPDNSGQDVNIYVIDTGINTKHNDLEGRASFGTAFLGNRSEERDLNGHGTFVAGVLAGKFFGVAKKANIISVRALQPDGSGRLSVVLQAIDWVIKQHNNSTTKKTIINLSLGAEYSQATNEAIKNAMALGIHFTIAAGNEGKDACQFSPASVQGALTVGATNSDDTIATYSNTGNCVDIYAPGTNINSIWNTSKSATHVLSGTSMASPHVAGVMAILLSQGNYTPPELVKKIKEMATVFNKSATKKGARYPPLLLYTNLFDDDESNSTIVQYKTTNNASAIIITNTILAKILILFPLLMSPFWAVYW
ncbi:6554_t:CDS:2 [Ambispora gerdemannii]|uniref:6554_t:CDS:1 n=1 Tax=Ambispora gerdemannii TaxID=144530 RepID=A0A9N8VIC7_9GLOM|nr:6554_t:CDS:2 [Ambispora gerdemannii]